MASSAGPLNKIERAHQMYREGRYRVALAYYTEALAMAKTRPQRIALHSNRAACYLKLHDFKQAAEECTSVLELDHKHTGALMLRAQTLVTLKEYHSALFDVNRLIELDPSSEVYKNLEARLRTQLSLAPIAEAELEEEQEQEAEDKIDTERDHVEPLHHVGCDTTGLEKGREQMNNRKESREQEREQEADPQKKIPTTDVNDPQAGSSAEDSKGWQAIPKPKGHSTLDYARWDRVEDESSEEEDDDDDGESTPQYRFRVRTVGVRPVK